MKQIFLLVLVCLFANHAFAQEVPLGAFGDERQPGHRLHEVIEQRIEDGLTVERAIGQSIMDALEQTATIVDAESKSVLAFDLAHAQQFYAEMVSANSLIEVTKVLTEALPEKAPHTIQLGVILYPDYVQEVYDGAMLAGVMSPEDVMVAMIQSGADPTTFGAATAAAPAAGPAVAVVPLGTGIGAAGAGGDEQVASQN